MSDLKVWSDGVNTVIAESPSDASAVYEEYMGLPWVEEDSGEHDFCERTKPLTIRFEQYDDVPEFARAALNHVQDPIHLTDGVPVTLDVAGWVAGYGRSYVACSEV